MKKTLAVCTILLACAFTIQAQVANNTSLVGSVFDPSGNAITSATVIAVETSTGVKSSGETNGEGYYAITFILLSLAKMQSAITFKALRPTPDRDDRLTLNR